MKILFITNQFNPPRSTGSGRSSTLIYKELKNRGHNVDLLIFDKKKEEKRYEKTRYGRYYRHDTKLSAIEEFTNIKDGEYDVIHQYGGGSAKFILPAICGNFKQTKLITTFNGTNPGCWYSRDYDRYSSKCCRYPKNMKCAMKAPRKRFAIFYPLIYIGNKLRRFYTKKYDKYFALSEPLKKLFSKSGFKESKISIIPNFFDLNLYEKFNNMPVENTKKTVSLYVGRIAPEKGVDNLLGAYKILNPENCELRIVGDGFVKDKLEKKYKSESDIKFLGKLDYQSKEFVRNYLESDIFVHPGIWPEPFGRTILEAGMAKNAVIVSNIGAPPEVLKDKALRYPPRDVGKLARKLKYLIENPEKRKKLAKEAHEYVIEEYSVEKSINKLEKEYKNLLE